MDPLYPTPFVDCFRRGEVSTDIRLLAAQGILAPRAHEQLSLLVLLSGDSDSLVRGAAAQTLARIPTLVLERFLGRPEVPDDVRAFFADRGILPFADADVTDEAPQLIDEADDPVGDPEPGPSPGDPASPEAERHRVATAQRLAMLTITQKVKVAMRGAREERAILIRDPNKLVAVAVLSSPKLTVQEVGGFARMGSVSEDALRVIASTRAWVKNYGVVQALVFNPKTPVAMSLPLVKRLLEREVRALSTDRNVPDPLKIAARKMMQTGQTRRG
jgi:hypothetical protein